jgi:steroid delta-isomerase-like uncharacterized protein
VVTVIELDHVTAIVDDADAAAALLERVLGTKPCATLSLPGMTIRSFRLGGGEIHLNAPTGPGPVEEHHRRHGPGYHHIALRVSDLESTLRGLAARGFPALGTPVETAPGLREVFLDPANTGGLMLQIVERRETLPEAYELDGDAVVALAAQAPEARSLTRGAKMSREHDQSGDHLKVRARKIFDDVISRGDLQLADELIHPDYVDLRGGPKGLEGFKQGLASIRAAFPDWTSTVDDMIAEGDRVAARWTIRGTHRGAFMGVPPTGRQVTMREAGILRFSGGKLIELGRVADELSLMQQLGVLPPLGAPPSTDGG